MATCPNSKSDTDSEVIQFDYSTLPRRFKQPSDKTKRPSRCSAADCCKRFKDKLQSRDCGLCGAVFCQQCTIYRRRICRVSGIPFDLGILTNVCEKCFKGKVDSGCAKDHLGEFKRYRKERLEADSGKPACSRAYTGTKLIQKELNRLMEGFAASASDGFLAGLPGKKTPEWQKSATWVEPGNENKCYQCKRNFGVFYSKHNCRIGGQVCCTKCIKEGLIIYQDDRGGETKWGINGRDNGPKTKYRLEIYMICSSCLDHLETVPVDMSSQKRQFMDSVCEIHKSTSRMQRNIDKWLPEYQQEVEALKVGMRNEAADLERKLAMLHLNLSTTLPAIDGNVNRLLELHQQLQQSPVGEQQQKLLINVLIGTESSYKEHTEKFHCTKTKLLSQLSREKLCQVQEEVNQKSILYVYAIVKKLAIDLQDYTENYNFEGKFLEDVIKIEHAITEEFKQLPTESQSCNWEELMRDKACTSIDVAQMVRTSANSDHVKIVVASQSSTILQQCLSKLKDETLDLEFQKTKQCLKQAWDQFEMTLRTSYN